MARSADHLFAELGAGLLEFFEFLFWLPFLASVSGSVLGSLFGLRFGLLFGFIFLASIFLAPFCELFFCCSRELILGFLSRFSAA